jgi:hypothetical protein
MPILRAGHTIVSLTVLGCVSCCQCQVRAVQAKLLPALILVAAGIASMMSGNASLIIAVERFTLPLRAGPGSGARSAGVPSPNYLRLSWRYGSVSSARPSGSGSTFRGDMTGSGPGPWRAYLGE